MFQIVTCYCIGSECYFSYLRLSLPTKRKRKRRASESDFSDNEDGSGKKQKKPEEDDDPNKRRSGRNQGSRKKYIDELDLDLSDDDEPTPVVNGPEGDRPNMVYVVSDLYAIVYCFLFGYFLTIMFSLNHYASSTVVIIGNLFVQDPNNEDSMVVQIILNVRMGVREVVSDSEDDEDVKPKPAKNEAKHENRVNNQSVEKLEVDDTSKSEKVDGEVKTPISIVKMKEEPTEPATSTVKVKEEPTLPQTSIVKVEPTVPPTSIVEVNDEPIEKSPPVDSTGAVSAEASAATTGETAATSSSATAEAKPNQTDAVTKTAEATNIDGEVPPKDNKSTTGKASLKKKKSVTIPRKIEVEEFFVKYKNFSYLHCDWRTEEELLKGDKRIQGKIRRYKQKRGASMNIMDFVSYGFHIMIFDDKTRRQPSIKLV